MTHYAGRILPGERALPDDRRPELLPQRPRPARGAGLRGDHRRARGGGGDRPGLRQGRRRRRHHLRLRLLRNRQARTASPSRNGWRRSPAETGLRIVGPNCIGVVNALLDSRVTFMDITPIPQPRPHAVGIISQSGALGMALAQGVVRGLSVSHVLTSGNSCDVDMADYVSYLADDPACASIACVFEGMATPERLLLAAEKAWAARQAAGDVQDGDRRAGCSGGDVAYRIVGRVACGLPRGVPAGRRGAWWMISRR